MNKETKARLIKLAQEAESNDEHWEFAQALLDDVPDGRPRRALQVQRADEEMWELADAIVEDANDGSYADLEELAHDIVDETGYWFTVARLRALRATARAWPPEERDAEVSFAVHERLRGSKDKLAVYKRRAMADYKRSPGLVGSPRLTTWRVANYRADEKPMVPWLEARKKTLRSVAAKATGVASLDQLEVAFRDILAERRKELGG